MPPEPELDNAAAGEPAGGNSVPRETEREPAAQGYAQADLDRVAGKTRAEERARYDRQLAEYKAENPAPTAPPKDKPKAKKGSDVTVESEMSDRIAALETRAVKAERANEINSAITAAGLDDVSAKTARALFANADSDSNAAEWLGEAVKEFGLGTKETDNKEAAAPSPTITDRAAPSVISDYERVTDPNLLSQEDHRAMLQKYGQAKYTSMIRRMVESHYRGKKVLPE